MSRSKQKVVKIDKVLVNEWKIEFPKKTPNQIINLTYDAYKKMCMDWGFLKKNKKYKNGKY